MAARAAQSQSRYADAPRDAKWHAVPGPLPLTLTLTLPLTLTLTLTRGGQGADRQVDHGDVARGHAEGHA